MEMNSKFGLGQVVYFFDYNDKGSIKTRAPVEAILVEKGVLNKVEYHYLVNRKQWKPERELFETEEELDKDHDRMLTEIRDYLILDKEGKEE